MNILGTKNADSGMSFGCSQGTWVQIPALSLTGYSKDAGEKEWSLRTWWKDLNYFQERIYRSLEGRRMLLICLREP